MEFILDNRNRILCFLLQAPKPTRKQKCLLSPSFQDKLTCLFCLHAGLPHTHNSQAVFKDSGQCKDLCLSPRLVVAFLGHCVPLACRTSILDHPLAFHGNLCFKLYAHLQLHFTCQASWLSSCLGTSILLSSTIALRDFRLQKLTNIPFHISNGERTRKLLA